MLQFSAANGLARAISSPAPVHWLPGAPPRPHERSSTGIGARSAYPAPIWNSTDHLLLATQAYDDSVSGRCPALAPDGSCRVHADRKPALCSAVPLEPLLPDAQQGLVIAKRARDAAFLGANCLKPGAPAHSLPLLDDSGPTPQARLALEQRRTDLARDKRFWGDAVYRTLPAELFSAERVPTNALLTLSIVPAIGVVAQFSEASRLRCREYLLAQGVLIQSTLAELPAAAVQARRELNGFARSGAALLRLLEHTRASASPAVAREVEAWLGLA